MKRIIMLLAVLALLLCGCREKGDDAIAITPVKVFLSDVTSDLGSVSLYLRSLGGDTDAYDTWGIVYGESSDKDMGTEKIMDTKPSDGAKEITLTGLNEGATYFIWGWAEGKKAERVWSRSVSIKVRSEADPVRLEGTPLASSANGAEKVHDGDFDTYYSSGKASGSWVGLDLGKKHVIRRVGYSPRKGKEGDVELAIIEGADEPDFSDAVPVGMIKTSATSGTMHYLDITCSKGFRYVRYSGPADSYCNLSEIEFYGVEGEGDDSQYYQLTNLPTVVINTDGAKDITSKEDDIPSMVYIISDDGTSLLAAAETDVRGRGNASWLYPKKPYRLKFDSKQSPLGAPASAKKWTLINNWGDKTLMRNILAFEVNRRVGQSYTPFCQPVDLVLNGEYRGCYQFCDQVEAASGRVEAKDGYLIEIDAYAPDEEVWFSSSKGTPVTIKHPDEEDITSAQKAFIEDYFNVMEAAVFSSDFADPDKGYRKYLDLDSFLRNFIVGEFGGNTDTFWSVYMYKDDGDGKLYTGPAWDYDLAFANDQRTHPILGLNDYIYCTKGSLASSAMKTFVSRIVKEDPQAKARLVEIWENACDNADMAGLVDYVDRTADLLRESQELNFRRWQILDERVHQNYQALGSYSAEVDVVKAYITGRMTHFDQLVRK